MKMEEIKEEYRKLQSQLSSPEFFKSGNFQEASKRFSEFQKIIERQEEIANLEKKLKETEELQETDDLELKNMAQTEMQKIQKDIEKAKSELKKHLQGMNSVHSTHSTGSGQADSGQAGSGQAGSPQETKINDIIVEIRAGTGGEEAALFAADLLRMYLKFAENQNWQVIVLSAHPTEVDGYKEISFEIKGQNCFSKMQYEGGVHRVQRIPTTEKGGRIHTSTASVAVLPKAKGTDIAIKPEEIKIETYRASGPGGQYVNKRESAVRVTHLPTGIIASSQTARTQFQNKENAMSLLRTQLLAKKIEEEETKLGKARKAQIGKAERAEKIRTYNFPQDRITDHRIPKSWHNIEKILSGNLGPIIEALSEVKQ